MDSITVLAWNPTIVAVENVTIPSGFSLSQNSPNPFRASTQMLYSLPSAAHVRATLRDALGRVVRVLEDADRAAGTYTLVIDGSLPTGLYLCTLEAEQAGAGPFTETRRILKVD